MNKNDDTSKFKATLVVGTISVIGNIMELELKAIRCVKSNVRQRIEGI